MADDYGTDILMTDDGDIQAAPGGDLSLVSGIDNLNQAITNRLLTTPDEYLFGEYGCTLRQYVDVLVDASVEDQITQDVNASLLEDSRIANVPSATVTQNTDGSLTLLLNVTSAFGDGTSVEVGT